MEYILDNTLDTDGIKVDKQNNKVYLGHDIYHWLTKKFERPSSKSIIKRRKGETSRFDRNIDLRRKVRKG